MENGIDVIFQFITFNPVEINGKQTFDNMFIVLDSTDKIGAGMVYPQEVQNV
jgi:hypothetical protein